MTAEEAAVIAESLGLSLPPERRGPAAEIVTGLTEWSRALAAEAEAPEPAVRFRSTP